jgi:hypothetical protein
MSCKKITSARLYACEKHTITEAETSGATPSWESFCQLCLSKKKREEKEIYFYRKGHHLEEADTCIVI